ncbi:MAG: YceD family protein [Caldimonas sp.]
MSSRPAFDPARLDVAAFAAGRGAIGGSWPLRSLRRLAESTVPLADGGEEAVQWQAEGTLAPLLGAGLQPALRIVAAAGVGLECQRCLQRMVVPLSLDQRLFFVPGEDAAAGLDAESDDDVLALEPALDLRSLIEDELLLALPLVPRHELCPEPLPVEPEPEAPASEHPFAALAALKRGPASS